MKKIISQDLICSLIFIGIGAFFYRGSLILGVENRNSGAEYFPKIISIAILLLSLIYLIKALKNSGIKDYFKNDNKINKSAFFKVIGVVIIFISLWPYVPFIILSSVYLLTLGYIFKAELVKSLLFSISTSVIIYMIFSKIFHVMLN